MKKDIIFLLLVLSMNIFGQKVYNFSLKSTDNNILSYNELKGENLTVIDFWATWCKPCQQSIPIINKIHEEFRDKGLNVIGINIDNPRNYSKIKPFINSMGIQYPVLLDFDQEVMRDFNVFSIPVIFIINNKNEIVYIHEGYSPGDESDLKNEINNLLNNPDKK